MRVTDSGVQVDIRWSIAPCDHDALDRFGHLLPVPFPVAQLDNPLKMNAWYSQQPALGADSITTLLMFPLDAVESPLTESPFPNTAFRIETDQVPNEEDYTLDCPFFRHVFLTLVLADRSSGTHRR